MMLDDLATWLDTQSTGLAVRKGTAGNLLKGQVVFDLGTDFPNTLVGLYETQGIEAWKSFSTSAYLGIEAERPRLQVTCRSSDYPTGRNLIETVYTLLDGIKESTLPTSTAGTVYHSVDAAHPPFFIGRDDNQRCMFVCNFQVVKAVG